MRLAIELVPTTAQAFGAGTGGQRTARAQAKPEIEEGAVQKPKNRAKPVILIDAGHGGVDPGAMSPHGAAGEEGGAGGGQAAQGAPVGERAL